MTSTKLDVILKEIFFLWNHSQGKNLLHKEFVTVIVTNLALKNYIRFMLFIKKTYPSRLGIILCLTNRARGFFKNTRLYISDYYYLFKRNQYEFNHIKTWLKLNHEKYPY